MTTTKPSRGDTSQNLQVALVCDWLTTPGGAEKVLLSLHQMYPKAPIYTSQYSKKGINWFDDVEVHTGWLQIFPAGLRKFLGPLRQIYFSHLDLSEYDLVISVTGAEAKSIRTKHKNPSQSILPLYHTSSKKSRGKALSGRKTQEKSRAQDAYHLCYCHVPTQYYWQMYDRYLENPGFGILNPLVRFFFKLLVGPLRKADYRAAKQPDQFITISEYAREQIEKYYQRRAVIIAPPVETSKFTPTVLRQTASKTKAQAKNAPKKQFSTDFSTKDPADFHQGVRVFHQDAEVLHQNSDIFHKFSTSFPQGHFIIACRQVTWKKVDLAIKACLKAKLPLLVVGDGPENEKLRSIADNSPLIGFIPWAQTEDLAIYLQNARGYIFPSLEPFGIAAVEALAAGCPVIAYAEGGSRDFVKNGQNGLLFQQQTIDSLAKALQKFAKMHFNRAKVSQSAKKFDQAEFRQGMEAQVAQAMVHLGRAGKLEVQAVRLKPNKSKSQQIAQKGDKNAKNA